MTVGKVKDFNFASGPVTKNFAKGGKVSEAPRMQRKEVMMRETVKAPSAPQGMVKSRGTLGVMANKNPGETRMKTAPNLPGDKMMMKKGGVAMSMGGMHQMPDGKMMPDNMMMKKGGSAMSKSKKNC